MVKGKENNTMQNYTFNGEKAIVVTIEKPIIIEKVSNLRNKYDNR